MKVSGSCVSIARPRRSYSRRRTMFHSGLHPAYSIYLRTYIHEVSSATSEAILRDCVSARALKRACIHLRGFTPSGGGWRTAVATSDKAMSTRDRIPSRSGARRRRPLAAHPRTCCTHARRRRRRRQAHFVIALHFYAVRNSARMAEYVAKSGRLANRAHCVQPALAPVPRDLCMSRRRRPSSPSRGWRTRADSRDANISGLEMRSVR